MKFAAIGRILLASLILLTANAALAQKPSKGGGGSTAPSLPVKYEVVRLGVGNVRPTAINGCGQLTGWTGGGYGGGVPERSFLATVDAESGKILFYDLNDLSPLWIDMEAPEDFADGWTASRAFDINDMGDVVGTARNAEGRARAYLFSRSDEVFYLLPTMPGLEGDNNYTALGVNKHGEIVGRRFEIATGQRYLVAWHRDGTPHRPELDIRLSDDRVGISDDGVIAANQTTKYNQEMSSIIYNLHLNWYVSIPNVAYGAINSMGEMGGVRLHVVKNASYREPVRFYETDLSDITVLDKPESFWTVSSLNNNRDVLYQILETVSGVTRTRRMLFTDRSGKPERYNLDDLSGRSFKHVGTAVLSNATPLTDPRGTGFGMIGLNTEESDAQAAAYVLIPRKP
jgi:probable HAF family extracellular repeat protein